jgi:hypothetical protein
MKHLKQIIVMLVAIIFIIASGGFNVVHHSCDHKGISQKVFSVSALGCDESDGSICCVNVIVEQENSCCESNPAKETRSHSCGDDPDCCNTEYVYYQTDQFDYTKPIKKKISFVSFTFIADKSVDETKVYNDKIPFLDQLDLPPPDYGRELLCRLHQLKIDTLFA